MDDVERPGLLLDGHIRTQLVASAVRFQIPDHLADRTLTDTALSGLTGIGVPTQRRYMRALEGLALRGIAFEQPAAIAVARQTMEDHAVTDRCELAAGDFLTEVPRGADLYLIKSVIHDWTDESALRILRNCLASVGERGRLHLVERALKTDDALEAALRDLSMLVLLGGQSRAIAKHEELLRRTGFSVEQTLTAPSGFCLIEARPELRRESRPETCGDVP